MKLFKLLFSLTLMLMVYISTASAEYSYQLVIPPGAENANLFGINKAGKVVGRTFNDLGFLGSFEYDMKSGVYTNLEEGFRAFGISNSGVMVGDVDGVCAIRDKKGNITTFFPPAYTENSFCQARGVNANGKVSGFVIDDDVWFGFIYDSEYDTYEEFLHSPVTIANGINAQGQNVGSVYRFGGDVYTDSPEGRYGYLREPDGSIRYFEISQSLPGWTNIRGISENGLISGFFLDPATLEFTGFATTIPEGNEFETITLTHDQVLHLRPCYPGLPSPPGEGYVLLTDVFTHQVRNDGVVVGRCTDYHYNSTTGDEIEYTTYGLIATPIRKGNQGGGKCLPPPAGMTNWWPGDGNSIDIFGGLHGAFEYDATTGPGLVDLAFTLDGDEDFINVPHNSDLDLGTDDFTVDLWVNFNDTSGEQVLVEKWVQGDGFVDGWTLTKLYNNVLRLAFDKVDGEEFVLDSNVLTILPGNWYHFAATRKGYTFTLFMNGWEIARDVFEGPLNLNSDSSLKFGHRGNPNDTDGSIDWRGFYLNGRIDEVELFVGTALSKEQIMALYAAAGRGKCKDGL